MEARGDQCGYQSRGKRIHWVTHTLEEGRWPGMDHFYHRHQNNNTPQGVDRQVSMGQVGICRVSVILQTDRSDPLLGRAAMCLKGSSQQPDLPSLL